MKRLLYITAFILTGGVCTAQQKAVDSIINLLNKRPQEDTIQLNLLLNLAYSYEGNNNTRGLAAAGKAVLLAQKLNNPAKLGIAYHYTGILLESNGDYKAALDVYNKCMQIRMQLNDAVGIAKLNHNMGIVYYDLGDYNRALQCQQDALAGFEKLKDKEAMAGALNSIGVIYFASSNYPKAVDYYLQSQKLYEQAGNTKNVAFAYGNIGLVYTHLNNFTQALEYHRKSLEVYEKAGDEKGMARSYDHIGTVYDDLNDTGMALKYYKKALAINQKINDPKATASNLSNIGILYNYAGNYAEALTYLPKAVSIYEQSGDKLHLSVLLNAIGNAYSQASPGQLKNHGINPENQYSKALAYQKQALTLAVETGSVETESLTWESIGKTYEAQHNFGPALSAYKKFIALRDSTVNDEKKEEIARKTIQFEFDKKQVLANAEHDKKQALALAEINRQKVIRNAVTFAGLVLLAAAMLIFAFYKRKRDADQLKKEADFNALVSDTEMKALRSQMNPHFIFNSLNSINDYISKNNMKAADLYLTKFAKVMRLILENSEQKEVPLADDLKALELYMQLEALRMNNKFTYEIKVDENIDAETTLIPPLLLQPFVENSIWHGIAKKEGEGRIAIFIKKEDDMINCIVQDNGIGRQQSAFTKDAKNTKDKKSLGMKITNARIDIMNQLKKTKAAVELTDLEQGTRVEVKLPLQLSF